LVYSCNNNTLDEPILAEVEGEYLYPSYFLGQDYTEQDVQNISDEQKMEWVKKQLWYLEAEKNIEETSILDIKVEEYKQSLYINAFQDELLGDKTNLVTNESIVKYFSEHREEYLLKENLYKIQYVEFSSEMINLEEIITSLNNEVESQIVIDHCKENKHLCLLNPTWVSDDKLNDLGLPDFVRKTSAKFEQYYKSDNKVCIYRILERKLEGEYYPLELANKEIASIVYFNKSKEILKKQEDKLLKNAQNKQNFEIY